MDSIRDTEGFRALPQTFDFWSMEKSVRIWVDDVRPLPPGYDVWYQSVREVLDYVTIVLFADENHSPKKILLDLDHDAGNYQRDGGDFIRILDYFVENNFVASHPETEFIFRIHSANPVGRANMERIIKRNGWNLQL